MLDSRHNGYEDRFRGALAEGNPVFKLFYPHITKLWHTFASKQPTSWLFINCKSLSPDIFSDEYSLIRTFAGWAISHPRVTVGFFLPARPVNSLGVVLLGAASLPSRIISSPEASG